MEWTKEINARGSRPGYVEVKIKLTLLNFYLLTITMYNSAIHLNPTDNILWLGGGGLIWTNLHIEWALSWSNSLPTISFILFLSVSVYLINFLHDCINHHTVYLSACMGRTINFNIAELELIVAKSLELRDYEAR